MKELYALQGTHDCGKTETLNNVIHLLEKKYPNASKNIMLDGKDKKVIFENVNGLKVGIETQGDPDSRLEKSLIDFQNMNCDIIICSCRTRGMTVDWVNNFSDKYKIVFINQTIDNEKFFNSNMEKAISIVKLTGL